MVQNPQPKKKNAKKKQHSKHANREKWRRSVFQKAIRTANRADQSCNIKKYFKFKNLPLDHQRTLADYIIVKLRDRAKNWLFQDLEGVIAEPIWFDDDDTGNMFVRNMMKRNGVKFKISVLCSDPYRFAWGAYDMADGICFIEQVLYEQARQEWLRRLKLYVLRTFGSVQEVFSVNGHFLTSLQFDDDDTTNLDRWFYKYPDYRQLC